MRLHIFNPEHDIALAADLANFTSPHAGRQLRHDLGFLPALWAEEGDVVVVDDVELAQQSLRKTVTAALKKKVAARFNEVKLVSGASGLTLDSVSPWGWDRAVRARLQRCGVGDSLLPTDEQLDLVRRLSHRRVAMQLLPSLRLDGTVGESFECTSEDEVNALLERFRRVVLKAPWSSSGRGIRFLDASRQGDTEKTNNERGWLRNVIKAQGSVMVEPYYNKVKDFGMEFSVDADGKVHYEGLSLFHTMNGAYTGNILASEQVKLSVLGRYLPETLLHEVQQTVCTCAEPLLRGYHGPFGIDMMVVANNCQLSIVNCQFLLHPCVEINLRRTMGHVALSLTPQDDDVRAVMRIEYVGGSYHLKLTNSKKNNIDPC